MKAKIEWYQEVLALEPGSKVFFPLARALSGEGRRDHAVQVLRRGLEMHPEFLEARVFLIQLLHDAGEEQECRKELERMTELLASYPGFWKAWSDAWRDRNPDVGLVLGYMAVARQQPELSLRRVLELGLKAAAAETLPGVPEETPESPRGGEKPAGSPRVAGDACVPAGETVIPEEAREDTGPGAEEATVRTRSMAEVLAEQGDIAGALEIYRELAETASSPKERQELRRRMAELETQAGAAAPDETGGGTPPAGKDGLRTILENLAERLDARAR